MATRNMAPLMGVEWQARGLLNTDDLTRQLAELLAEIRALAEDTDLADDTAIAGQAHYDGLRLALDLARAHPSGAGLDVDYFVGIVAADLMEEYTPGIDEYVEQIHNVTVLDELGLAADDTLLLDVSADRGFDLRPHGLILSDTAMIYPHQFLRRFYHANFVRLPVLLRACVDTGLTVKLRVDPLRSWIHPRHYLDIGEKDYWYGKPFTVDLLANPDTRELRTLHRTNGGYHPGHAADCTLFRTSMMDDHQRQFMIEEYTPITDPYSTSKTPPGFGTTYCIQKFGHLVYDQQAGAITHLDGAVRVFTCDDYTDVHATITSGRDPGSKIGERHKLFLVEGILDLDLAQQLLTEFFLYNPHLDEYFHP